MGEAKRLKRKLGEIALHICKRFLWNGDRVGDFWRVGNIYNEKGGSCWVRINGPSDLLGSWGDYNDEGSGGDLLDFLQERLGLPDVRDAMDEARLLLSEPRYEHAVKEPSHDLSPAKKRDNARSLFDRSNALIGSAGETYLRARGIRCVNHPAIRFHPRARYRDRAQHFREGQALVARVTGPKNEFLGVHRTWFAVKEGQPKAIERKMMGPTLGGAVYLGGTGDIALLGEGLESTLSLDRVLPGIRLFASLSTSGMRNWVIPPSIKAVLVAVDRDENNAGPLAATWFTSRAHNKGVPAFILWPQRDDFNADLQADGVETLAQAVRKQIYRIELLGPLLEEMCRRRDQSRDDGNGGQGAEREKRKEAMSVVNQTLEGD